MWRGERSLHLLSLRLSGAYLYLIAARGTWSFYLELPEMEVVVEVVVQIFPDEPTNN